MHIYPSILSSSIAEVEKQINWSSQMAEVETVQIDVIDGIYTDNITVSPVDVAALNYGKLSVDFHFMVDDSYDYLHEVESNHTLLPVRSVITQVERLYEPGRFLFEVRERDWLAGLSLNLDTPISAIHDDWWQLLDVIQVMAIDAGFQGQEFNTKILPLVEEIRRRIQLHNWPIELIVDGGVKVANISSLAKAGASSVAVGSDLWNSPNPIEKMQEFEKVL